MKTHAYSDFINFDFSAIIAKYLGFRYRHHKKKDRFVEYYLVDIKLASSSHLECIEVTSKDNFGDDHYQYYTVDGFMEFLNELELSQKKVQYKVYFEEMDDTIGTIILQSPPDKRNFIKIHHIIKINPDGSEELYKI